MKYFDYAASTPMDPDVLEAYMQAASQVYGNTESLHDIGGKAQYILNECRKKLAGITGVKEEGLYFSSGGTESNLLSLLALAQGASSGKRHIISTHGEHASVHSAMEYLKEHGFEVEYLSFTTEGTIDLQKLSLAIRDDTLLVSIQHVNSEIGSIQPIKEISELIKGKDILLHCDCVQSFGKVDLKSITPYMDSFTVSSHKIHGPKGVGAFYINPLHQAKPVFPGLSHERGMRGGTVNIPGIFAFMTASEKAAAKLDDWQAAWDKRDYFLELLRNEKPHIFGSMDKDRQLPYIIGMAFDGIEGQLVMLEANTMGFSISTGSACHTGQQEPANAMKAMGVDVERAKSFFRISFSKTTTHEQLFDLAKALKTIYAEYKTVRA
ncbi:IscS subfamily cysteine desulfurase [Falsibacillus pallidus]|uniref:Cysteine desulfurase n=1 Tax=Falsibacillus pallidus TaxID=493781 RepID=A0A370GQ90_9BACI|nr:IscS subfamily cysteine desulfurase [Falsibacillus pallidus]RDI44133.1 cysteine desulfurase [Falsibacillus pallidus]